MTESTFPFAGPADPPPSPDSSADEERTGNRRALLLAGGVAAAVCLAGGVFLTLGGEDEEPMGGVVQRAPRAAAAAATGTPAPKLPVPFDEDLGRDPFRALYVVPAADVPAGPDRTGTDATAAPTQRPADTALPAAGGRPAVVATAAPPVAPPVAPLPSRSASPRPASPAPAATPGEHRLVLVEVAEQGGALEAVFTVDGVRTAVRVDGVFGPRSEIRLLALQEGPASGQWTAVLQVGDGEPFDVVTGGAVSVR